MPPNTARVAAAVLARIESSDHVLTIWYPPVRATPAGTGPQALPVSPLMKAPSPARPDDEEPTSVVEPVSMPCLFTELTAQGDAKRQQLLAELAGWAHEARGLVRVRRQDIERPSGGVWFEGATHVDVNGRKYKVLGWAQMGNTMTEAATYTAVLGSGT